MQPLPESNRPAPCAWLSSECPACPMRFRPCYPCCPCPAAAHAVRAAHAAHAIALLQVLKFLINQARPSDRKADPGMPSAHANSLAFLVKPSKGAALKMVVLTSGRASMRPCCMAPVACAALPHPAQELPPPVVPLTGHFCCAGWGSRCGPNQPAGPSAGGGRAHTGHLFGA